MLRFSSAVALLELEATVTSPPLFFLPGPRRFATYPQHLLSTPELMVDPVVLDQVGQWAQHFANTTGLSRGMALPNTSPGTSQEAAAVSPAVPVTEMWLGETGSAVGGGAENVSPGAFARRCFTR